MYNTKVEKSQNPLGSSVSLQWLCLIYKLPAVGCAWFLPSHRSVGAVQELSAPNPISGGSVSSKRAMFALWRELCQGAEQTLPGAQPARECCWKMKTRESLRGEQQEKTQRPRRAGEQLQTLHSCQPHTSCTPDKLEPATEQVQMGKAVVFR